MKRIISLFPFVCAGIMSVLFVIVLYNFKISSKVNLGSVIVHELTALHDIFERIDETCHISSFDFQHNVINFLTIKKDGFVGSEVGSMNLTYPDKWEGPYVTDNPSIQGIEFLIVKTEKGYFITPGLGVKLPNGLIVGKDLSLDSDSDIHAMIQEGGALNFQGEALAVPFQFGRGHLLKIAPQGISFPAPEI